MANDTKVKAMSKSEILKSLSEATNLPKKDVVAVLDELAKLVAKSVGKKGPGVFALPGLIKIKVVSKKAAPAKKGVPNPFKPGELMDVAAKPARRLIKVQALKALKDMAKP